VTVVAFEQAFTGAQAQAHPTIDAFEQRMGYALDRERLETAARVLACPVKANPPSWQHGRVLYAIARHYLQSFWLDATGVADDSRRLMKGDGEPVSVLDIGTAKGFSALCLQWALNDAGVVGTVTSVDVIDPKDRVSRNTVAECDGLKTLAEILAPWPEASAIQFAQSTGRQWLTGHTARVHLASVDGKHSYSEVGWEAALLATRQHAGDVIFFDDMQIPGVAQAVHELSGYDVEPIECDARRRYAIARKR
jgi:hypothetical protein